VLITGSSWPNIVHRNFDDTGSQKQ